MPNVFFLMHIAFFLLQRLRRLELKVKILYKFTKGLIFGFIVCFHIEPGWFIVQKFKKILTYDFLNILSYSYSFLILKDVLFFGRCSLTTLWILPPLKMIGFVFQIETIVCASSVMSHHGPVTTLAWWKYP